MKLAAMEDSITLWKLKMIKDSIMEVPNNGRNSTVEVATVEVASIEIATMEDSIIWKLETIQDSIMEVSMGGIQRWKFNGKFNYGNCNDRNCNDGRFSCVEIGNDRRFDNGGFERTVEVATMENSITKKLQRSYYNPFSLCAKLSSRTKRDC